MSEGCVGMWVCEVGGGGAGGLVLAGGSITNLFPCLALVHSLHGKQLTNTLEEKYIRHPIGQVW